MHIHKIDKDTKQPTVHMWMIYVDCINLCFKIINKTEWTNSNLYFLIGDSYKNIRYYKSAKKYLKKAKSRGSYKAESLLEELKKSYKNDKTQWLNK